MKFVFTITVKKGPASVAIVQGLPQEGDSITVKELADSIIRAEQLLEKLTGLRFHIDMETLS